MPGTGGVDIGKARFFYSVAPETATAAAWAQTPATVQNALNLMPSSAVLLEPDYEILANDGLLTGQGEYVTALTRGKHRMIYEPTFPLTARAVGRFVSSSYGADTKTAYGTGGYKHEMTPSESPIPFTVDTKINGADDATTGYLFTGVWCKSWTMRWQNGNDAWATFSPRLVMSRHYSAGADMTSYDTTGVPPYPGIHSSKVAIWTQQNNAHASAYDGSITAMTAAGVPTGSDGMSAAVNIGQLCRSATLTYDTGVNEDDLFAIGYSTVAGVNRGKPVAGNPGPRTFTLTLEFDINSTFSAVYTGLAAATQYSHTFIIGANDDYAYGANYGGFHHILPAMYRDTTAGVGGGSKRTTTLVFKSMDSTNYAYVGMTSSYDDINQDYA